MMRYRIPLLGIFLICGFLSGRLFAYDTTNQTYFPVLSAPAQLQVAAIWDNLDSTVIGMSTNASEYRSDVVMLGSLSGVLLKMGSSQGVYVEANADHRVVLQELASRRSISYQYVVYPSTPWTLIDTFKSSFGNRYVLYDVANNPDSLNVARMAAYKYTAIMVDVSRQATAAAHGLSCAFDCTSLDDQWVYNNWLSTWPRKDIAVEQMNDPSHPEYVCMNDYAAATGALAFFDMSLTTLRENFLTAMDTDSPLIGWGNVDELSYLLATSVKDTFNVAANYSYDLALLSAVRDPGQWPYHQATHLTPVPSANKHYVTFIMTDGDNIQWLHNGFILDERWWSSPARGNFKLGWGLVSAQRDLGSTIVEYLYDNALQDYFTGMVGMGAFYPGQMTSTGRQLHAERLNLYMRDIDQNVLVITGRDNDWTNASTVYSDMLAQPTMDGIFYWHVQDDYATYGGTADAMQWVGEKPVISARKNLWDGYETEAQLAAFLNAQPRDPFSPRGYSVIDVHVWTKTPEDVQDVIDLLDEHVEVVSPEELVKLVKMNLHPRLARYDIEKGDWRTGNYGTPSHTDFTLQTSSTAQSVDGTPCVKFDIGPNYGEVNMSVPLTDVRLADTVEFDLYGDSSGSQIRLKFWSSQYSAFFYKDLWLDWAGWRHFSYALDGSDGLLVYGATFAQVASSLNIFQVGGPWSYGDEAVFYLDNVRLTTRRPNIEMGHWQYGPYGTPSHANFTVSTSSTAQMVDATPSARFTIGPNYGEVNMSFGELDATNEDNVEFDLYGDGSEATIRVKFWSSRYAAFLYKDIELDFSGWQHFSSKLDGSDGLQVYGADRTLVAANLDVFQVGGPWTYGDEATFYLDNVRFTRDHIDLERGDWRRDHLSKDAAWTSLTYAKGSIEQQADGTPALQMHVGPNYGELNWEFGEMDAGDCTTLEFDFYGDNSGTVVRVKLWSSYYQAFIYKDLTINWSGWHHFSYALDGSDGLQVYGGSFAQVLSHLDIFQVGGPWTQNDQGAFYLDNIRLVR